MSLFGALVKKVVNVATLPVAVAKDVITLGGTIDDQAKSHTAQKLEQIKEEADDDD